MISAFDLPFGWKSEPPFAPADGERGQTVFKNLLKSQEFKYAQVNTGVEPQAAFIRPEGIVKLNPVTAVYMYIAFIIHPGNFKGQYPVGVHQSFNDASFFKLRVPVVYFCNRIQYFAYSLQILYLSRVFPFEILNNLIDIHDFVFK